MLFAALATTSFAGACTLRGIATAHAQATPDAGPGLAARFEPVAGPFDSTNVGASIAFVLENRGATPVTLDLDQLGSAIFALEFADATSGRRIYTIPPGLPPPGYQPRTIVLAAGASRRFVVHLNVFSPPLRAGAYTARVAIAGPRSQVLRFVVRGAQ